MLYNSICAKIRVMFSKRLTKNDYNELLKKGSLPEAINYLKNYTAYGDVLSYADENTLHRAELEKLLKTRVFNIENKLLCHLYGDESKYLKFMNIKNEIKVLKLAVRYLSSQNSVFDISDIKTYENSVLNLDIGRIENIKSISELIDITAGTKYESIIRILAKDNCDLFEIESRLDSFYLSYMWNIKDKYLKGRNLKFVTKSLGNEIDIVNIMNILRAKKYYKGYEEVILTMLIPYRYKLKKEFLAQLINSRDVEEALSAVNKTEYKEIFVGNNPTQWEHNIIEYMYRLNIREINNNKSMACYISYIHFLEIELSNLISVIESIRYGLDPLEAKKYIVGIDPRDGV